MDKQEVIDMLQRAEQMKHPWRQYPKKVIVHYGNISSRSLLAFKAASIKLGCCTLTADLPEGTLEDTVQTLQYYGDALVMFHPNEDSFQKALNVSDIPVIQAGKHSNISQALTDLYTIDQELRFRGIQIDSEDRSNLKVTFIGYSRNVQPLVKLLDLFPKIDFHFTQKEVPPDTDVLYVSQRQGTEDYRIDLEFLKCTKPTLILMHPFLRYSELAAEVDRNPRSVYFKQLKNGLYMRMAILDKALSASCSPTIWEWMWMGWSVFINRIYSRWFR